MLPNNNQFNTTHGYPSNLPSLSRPTVNNSNRLPQTQPPQAPPRGQPQFNFAANPATTFQRQTMNAVNTNNTSNMSNTHNQNQQQTNQMTALSLPSIAQRAPHPHPPPQATTGAPRTPPNTAAAYTHHAYYNNNAPAHNNNTSNINRSVAVAVGGGGGGVASNGHAVPYTISNIEQQQTSRKRVRSMNYGDESRKKQRLVDGTPHHMNMFNNNGSNNPTNAIPPPMYRHQQQQQQQSQLPHHPQHQQQQQQSVVSQREWRQSRQSAKFKMAMDILDQFKQNHGGKLPSLRAVMKMLKVGFPKAHEILDAYAAHIGVTKEKLMQDMTVRQEKKRSTKNTNNTSNTTTTRRSNKPSAAANARRVIANTTSAAAVSCADSFPLDVNANLQREICAILECSSSGARDKAYLHCHELECLVSEYESFYSLMSVNDRLRLAQSYFLLGSMYRSKNRRNFAYCYVERALSTFRDCNGLAFAAGYGDEEEEEEGGGGVCREDVGHFWQQIVEVYMLGGHILLGNAQYCDAKEMYSMAHKLGSKHGGQQAIHEALENLAVVSMYENCVDESIAYTQQMLRTLDEEEDTMKILNCRAYYACCLTLSASHEECQNGYKQYKEVCEEATHKFGPHHAATIAFYCYFGLHFVQIKDWKRATKHIEYVMNVDAISATQMNAICDLLNDYCVALLENKEEEEEVADIGMIDEMHCRLLASNTLNCQCLLDIVLMHVRCALSVNQ